jgi:hypothetical protein
MSILSQEEANAFDEYEEEWLLLTSQIQRELGRLVQDANNKSSNSNHNNSAQRRTLRKRLDRCRVVLVELTIEARYSSNSHAEKEDYLSRVKLYKIQVDSFEQHFSDIILSTELQDNDEATANAGKGAISRKEGAPTPPREIPASTATSSASKPPVVSNAAKREDLFKKGSSNGGSSSTANLSTRLKLNKQNEALERARRSVSDIEDVAGDIAEELHRNRETLEASRDKVHEMAGLTNEANRIVTRMKKRWFT